MAFLTVLNVSLKNRPLLPRHSCLKQSAATLMDERGGLSHTRGLYASASKEENAESFLSHTHTAMKCC